MSAALTYTCDVCGDTHTQDVSDDAAMTFSIRPSYPRGWYVGDEQVACERERCIAQVMRTDHDAPDDGPGMDTV